MFSVINPVRCCLWCCPPTGLLLATGILSTFRENHINLPQINEPQLIHYENSRMQQVNRKGTLKLDLLFNSLDSFSGISRFNKLHQIGEVSNHIVNKIPLQCPFDPNDRRTVRASLLLKSRTRTENATAYFIHSWWFDETSMRVEFAFLQFSATERGRDALGRRRQGLFWLKWKSFPPTPSQPIAFPPIETVEYKTKLR